MALQRRLRTVGPAKRTTRRRRGAATRATQGQEKQKKQDQ
jgi:hypothetical protein